MLVKFNDNVVLFDFCGIPMVGNKANGYAIGLNGEGAAVCQQLASCELEPDEIRKVDSALYEHLDRGGFFAAEALSPNASEGQGEDPGASGGAIPSSDIPGPLASAYLHVTQRCNLDCKGCYSLDEKRNRLDDLSLEDVCRAIRQLADAGVQQLVISGGEPFLRSDLPEIVKFAKQDCAIANVTVLCNGTRITRDALQRMKPWIDKVSVSFDGSSADAPAYIRGQQRFDQLVDAVRLIKDVGISAHIIPTAHARNLEELPAYGKLAEDLGVTMNFSLLTCEPDDSALGGLLPGEVELKTLGRMILAMSGNGPSLAMDAPVGLNLSVKTNCGAGGKSVSVDADGTIYPCHMLHRPEFAMGNIFTGSLSDALESDVAREMQGLCVQSHDGCSDCRHMYICGGGCRARSLFGYGNLHSRDSYCAMICEFYDQLGAAMNAQIASAFK